MPKRIALTQGKFTIVDDKDFEWLSQWKWHAEKANTCWYAARNISGQPGKKLRMHRAILNPPPGMEGDHINRDGLDNRRCNLRICTTSQNHMNTRKQRRSSGRYKGVSWAPSKQKWQAEITCRGERHWLGRFDDDCEAARAYNAAALKHFGEFAHLNMI